MAALMKHNIVFSNYKVLFYAFTFGYHKHYTSPVSLIFLSLLNSDLSCTATDASDWNQSVWEQKVKDLITVTLDHIDKEEFVVAFGKALLWQFHLYKDSSQDKVRNLILLYGMN